MRALALAAALAAAAPLAAAPQERPSDEEIFGAPAAPERPGPEATPTPGAQGRPPPPQTPQGAEAEQPPAPARPDPLAIGGQLYLRSVLLAQEGVPLSEWALSSPSIIDGYLDARPNDRVRGFVLARTFFDPTIDPSQPGPFGTPARAQTQVVLDQLWVNFDVSHRAFVTAGRQHVKWGVARFWNPTDYLHAVRRDPLALFDARTGTSMVKVHVPWEERGWNFYGVALLEGDEAANQAGKLGAGGRAEIVLGNAELGLDALVRKGMDPRFGLDLSAGVGEVDVYGEAALRWGSVRPLYRLAVPGELTSYQAWQPGGFRPAVTAGASWSYKYSDEDTFTVGGEYAFDDNGYAGPDLYPVLFVTGAFTPFYLGRHYAGAWFLLPKPGRWNDTTITLSTLANLSDRSFITRLDWQVLVLTYLRVEAYAAAHYGDKRGEFRLGVDIPAQGAVPHVSVAAQVFDAGLALRVAL
ncbi:hypothetical protein [Anaeromyxobacter paludicola]|uniref:Alginate export domain-containing protein n=1 Tax=Anaeromyxobacter paludicola TaxID=2918171 RepID=A0ABM7XBF3_9BACT|nr:hypothetical protein [Anaeromyxobacter paludicola]BDG09185.1 hypothetical protein AMPC_22980 [Anaeromyxobacter paludicola]